MVLWILRHLFAIAVLPFTVTVLVPIWIARQNGTRFVVATTAREFALRAAAIPVFWVGFALFLTSVVLFIRHGRGTLAPWDPPATLVVRGPYRYVRNPMISGVVFILLGEAMFLMSQPHLAWAVTFFAINAVYIPLLEEPSLADRFGESYREYCRNVPRLLPRVRPWSQR